MAEPNVGRIECFRRAYNHCFNLKPGNSRYIANPLTETTENLLIEWFIIQPMQPSTIFEIYDDPPAEGEENPPHPEEQQEKTEEGSNFQPPLPRANQIIPDDEEEHRPWIEEYNFEWEEESDTESTARDYPPWQM